MSSLTSSSTRTQVLAAYADNASYEEDASIAKAKAFVTAVRLLLSPAMSVKRSAHGGRGEEVELDLEVLRQELQDARWWLSTALAAQDNAGVVHADFTGFRE